MIKHYDVRQQYSNIPINVVKAIPWLRAGLSSPFTQAIFTRLKCMLPSTDHTTGSYASTKIRLYDRQTILDVIEQRAAIAPQDLPAFDAQMIVDLKAQQDRTNKARSSISESLRKCAI